MKLPFCMNFPDTLRLFNVCGALSRHIFALAHTDDVAFNAKAPATPWAKRKRQFNGDRNTAFVQESGKIQASIKLRSGLGLSL